MKKTTAMQIAEEIATRIGKGILYPGQHLIETTLAMEFNTSRAPVREALLMLERDGLVQRIPHHGVIVRRFTRAEIYDLYDVIYRLEEIAMEKAVLTVSTEHVIQLELILKDQKQTVDAHDVQRYYEYNEEFHNLIFMIAGNQVLSDMYSSLRRAARPFRMLSMAHGNNLSLSLKEHQKQVEALREQEINSGIRAIQEQETRALRSLELLFPE